jgi:glycosyltransferase involved in cell wall biosynthesis
VNSLEFKNEMKKKFFIDAKCIYNPLNAKEIKLLAQKKVKFNFFKKNCINILNIGRFVDQKDHFTLLKALKVINHKINFRTLIIGKGINKNRMTEYIKSNQLNKKVKIINFKKNPYKYMRLCDVFILSSIYEGLPNVLLEAIALKKFVISSSCPTGPKEILNNGKGGFLFDPGNYQLLAKKIEIFYLKQKNLKNKSEYAYKKLYRFDYQNNLNEYLKIVLKYL